MSLFAFLEHKLNEIINPSTSVTMSSREIAELVEVRHDSVKRAIERMAARGVVSFTPAVETSHDGPGARPVEVYFVGKRDSYVIVAQLSPEFTARLVDRWQELEEKQAPVVALSRMDILKLAVESEERAIAAEAALAIAAPKIEFVDRYVDSTGNKGFRAVAKLLGANEARFREFLIDKKIMYRLGGEWMPFAQHMDTGRFVVKAGTSEESGHAFNQAKFTPKGVSWVAGQWMEWKLEQGEV